MTKQLIWRDVNDPQRWCLGYRMDGDPIFIANIFEDDFMDLFGRESYIAVKRVISTTPKGVDMTIGVVKGG